MTLNIVFTPRAQETLIAVYEFIHNKFGQRAALKYKEKTDKVIKSIVPTKSGNRLSFKSPS